MPEMMRALVGGLGPDWSLQDVPIPQPGPGQVLIRNQAAATNNGDIPMLDRADPMQGGHGEQFVAGFEYAGTVTALGDGVDAWQIGDAVMGSTPHSFAEYVVADHRHVLPRPAGLDPVVGCALPTGLLTEHGALTAAGFKAGQSVLITGASAGIGLIGVQIARALGASHVIGTTRTPGKRALLSEAGVDTVVVAAGTDLTEAVLAATGGRGADVVLDHVAGQAFAQCLAATRHDGHVVNIGRLDGPVSTIDLDHLSYRHLTVHGVSYGFTRPDEMAAVIAGLLPEVIPAVARGAIRPVVDRTVSWTEHGSALARLRSGAAVGKIVFTMSEE
ncbi:quinone oxidoreductase family protein [Nocardia mikamii]|uniref:quinone oxidoreductase family protein n=1 Tax=Nocardia mikamii TaxID=508464 RepID=UPI0007A3D143|nr:zinc-binding dehydrogenase [Nocardia mikamii]